MQVGKEDIEVAIKTGIQVFGNPNIMVQISCTDGLAALKGILYQLAEGRMQLVMTPKLPSKMPKGAAGHQAANGDGTGDVIPI